MSYTHLPHIPSESSRGEESALGDVTVLQARLAEAEAEIARLREYADHLRAVTDRVPVYIAHVDAGFRYKFVNQPYLARFGLRSEEVLGRHMASVIGAPAFEVVRGAIEKALSGVRSEYELQIPYERTGPRWMHGVNVPVYAPSGEIVGVIGVIEDVSERHEARERLRAEERLRREQLAELEAIYNTAPIGLSVLDRDLRFRRINSRLAEINGFSPAEHIGRSVLELLPDLAPQALDVVQRVLSTGQVLNVEIVGETPAQPGVRRIWDEHLFPLRLSGEEIDGVGVVAMEVTDQRRAEESLREREAALREAQRLAQLGSWSWNAATDAITGSEEFYRIFGMAAGGGSQVLHSGPLRAPGLLFPEDAWAALDAAIARTMADGTAFEVDLEARRGDITIWVTARGEVVRSEAGQAVGVRGTIQDVSDRRRAAEELRVAKEEAERANRAKDHFLAMLSHELRTPLTPVLMCAHLRCGDERLPAEARQDFAMIERNVRLEARLIDDMLDVTRLARGIFALDRELCDVHLLIRYAVETVAEAMRENKVTVRQAFRATASHLAGDASRLQQVFWNLLSNAVKFAPGGEVVIETHNVGDRLVVEVRDNGAGFAPEEADRIFRPFEQAAQAPAGQSAGLGLGLAIARGVVDLHGGTVHAVSEGPGRGATFTVDLPGATAPPHSPAEAVPPQSEPTRTRRTLNLLVVEDHVPTLRVLAALLNRAGYRFQTATTVGEALTIAEGQEFDVLVCDIGLPDGTGMDVMRALRIRRPEQPGVAVSGFGTVEDVARSRAAGFAVHLIKPVDFRLLEEAIRRVTSEVETA